MNVAKWLLWALFAFPAVELVVFVAVAAAIGFLPALTLLVVGSLAGLLILRHAGGNHISRMRATLRDGSVTALQADASGSLVLVSGILLLIPGFITGVLGLVLLAPPVRHAITTRFGKKSTDDGVVDLKRDQWHHVRDRELSDQRPDRSPE